MGVCAEDVHNRRFTPRGSEGKLRRVYHQTSWKEADALTNVFLDNERGYSYGRANRMSASHCRTLILQGLKLLAQNPEIDLYDDRVPDILQIILPPQEFELAIGKIRAVRPFGTSASSRDPPRTVADYLVPEVISSNIEPAAATFAGIVGHSAAESLTEQIGGAKFVSIPEIWDLIGTGKSPFFRENAVDPDLCTRGVPEYNPGNQPALDKVGKPCSHYMSTKPGFKQLIKIPRMFGPDHRLRAHQVGEQILNNWFSARPWLRAKLFKPKEQAFLWYLNTEPVTVDTRLHDIGKWYYFKLKQELPAFPTGTQTHMPRPTLGGKVFEEMVHCCSMYSLANCVMNGIVAGPTPGKGKKHGVYAFKRTGIKARAISSSGYCVYESLCNCGCGIYFGVRLCLEVQTWRTWEKDYSSISVGQGQMCLPPDWFHFVGFYIHVMTRDDLDIWSATHIYDDVSLWYQCGNWDPPYETTAVQCTV